MVMDYLKLYGALFPLPPYISMALGRVYFSSASLWMLLYYQEHLSILSELHNGCDYITMEALLTNESDEILLGDGQC